MYDSGSKLSLVLKKNRFDYSEFDFNFDGQLEVYVKDIEIGKESSVLKAAECLWKVLSDVGSYEVLVRKLDDYSGDSAYMVLDLAVKAGIPRERALTLFKYLLEEYTEEGYYTEKWLFVVANLFNLMAIMQYVGVDDIEQAACDTSVTQRLSELLPEKAKGISLTTMRRMLILRGAFLVTNKESSLEFDVDTALYNLERHQDIGDLCCFQEAALQLTQQWLAIHVCKDKYDYHPSQRFVGYYLTSVLEGRKVVANSSEQAKMWQMICDCKHDSLEDIWVFGTADEMHNVCDAFGINSDERYPFPCDIGFSGVYNTLEVAKERLEAINSATAEAAGVKVSDIGLTLKYYIEGDPWSVTTCPDISKIEGEGDGVYCYGDNLLGIFYRARSTMRWGGSLLSQQYALGTYDTGYAYYRRMSELEVDRDVAKFLADMLCKDLEQEVCYTEKWAWVIANMHIIVAFAMFVKNFDILRAYEDNNIVAAIEKLELPVKLTPIRIALIVRCVHSMLDDSDDKRYYVNDVLEMFDKYPREIRSLTVCQSDFQYVCSVDTARKLYRKVEGKTLQNYSSTYFLANYLESEGKWYNGKVISDVAKFDTTSDGVDVSEKVWMCFDEHEEEIKEALDLVQRIRFPFLVEKFPLSASVVDKFVRVIADGEGITGEALAWWKSLTKSRRKVVAIELVFSTYGSFKRAQINDIYDKAMVAGDNTVKLSEQCAVVADYLESEGYFHIVTDTITPLIKILQTLEDSK